LAGQEWLPAGKRRGVSLNLYRFAFKSPPHGFCTAQPWLVSYVFHFKLTNYNLRIIVTSLGRTFNGMELANKHHLGRKLRRSWLVSYVYRFK
ncbi:MAG: hypothetical protein AB7V25_12740, partial [Mangrovibacterium sp.]